LKNEHFVKINNRILVMSEIKFTGHTSVIKKDDKFDSMRLRIPRAMVPNLTVGTTVGTLSKTYEDKFKLYLALGVPIITDQFFEYRIEVTENEINFYGFTDTTVRLAFALFYKENVTDKKLTMHAEKALTFITRPIAPDESVDVPTINIFGIEDGDY
jgi:hypothetical protein